RSARGRAARDGQARVIRDNVRQIVGTRRGERVRRPSFGISCERILFEPADEVLFKLLRFEITEGLATWETASQGAVALAVDGPPGWRARRQRGGARRQSAWVGASVGSR